MLFCIYPDAQIVPDLASGIPLRLAPVSFWCIFIILWAHLPPLAQDVIDSSFFDSALETVISLGALVP